MGPDPSRDVLEQSLRRQADAAQLGFDWPDAASILDKLEEELGEIRQAVPQSQERRLDEVGDLLFVLVNLCRRLEVSPVDALAHANRKFDRRFAVVLAGRDQWETLAGDQRLQAMEALWQQAKRAEPDEP